MLGADMLSGLKRHINDTRGAVIDKGHFPAKAEILHGLHALPSLMMLMLPP